MQFKNLSKYRVGGTSKKLELAIPLPTTPDGRVYRYSPNDRAYPRHFVLGDYDRNFPIIDEARKRMKLNPRSQQTVCPYSGLVANDDDFTHPNDVKAAKKIFEHAARADVEAAVDKMFKEFAQKLSSSKFVKVSVKSSPSFTPRLRFWRRDLLRELVCDHCGRDYGVFALALYCPDCGAPNLKLHFAREIDLVSKQVELAEVQKDQQELAYRLLGNAHEDVLTAFEATLKMVYLHGIDRRGGAPEKPVRNDFQNILRAQSRFSELGVDPFCVLGTEELAELSINIQKRHVIGHNLGMADAKFVDFAATAKLGETVHLVGTDIVRFATLAQRIVNALDDWLVLDTASPLVSSTSVAIPTLATGNDDEEWEEMPDLDISSVAYRIGKWLCEASKDGLSRGVPTEKLAHAFGDLGAKVLGEGIAELEIEGYLTTQSALGSILPVYVAPTMDLFATFDPFVGPSSPIEDSKFLVEKIIEADSIALASLHQQTGWELRRFNPAIALIVSQIDECRISQELSSQYPVTAFFIAAEDRIALKRYLAQFEL